MVRTKGMHKRDEIINFMLSNYDYEGEKGFTVNGKIWTLADLFIRHHRILVRLIHLPTCPPAYILSSRNPGNRFTKSDRGMTCSQPASDARASTSGLVCRPKAIIGTSMVPDCFLS